MKKIKGSKIYITLFLAVFCLLFAFMPVAGCSNDEEKKYDVAIRIACSDGTVYEFPVGKEEKRDVIFYDGVKRTFKVTEYRLEGYSDHWLDIVGPNDYKFDITYLQYIGGENYAVLDSINGISEKGSYIIQIITNPEIMSLANFNEWTLSIEIK